MVNLKFQKRILLIPFVNIAILYIVIFVNSKYMENNWSIRSLVYCPIILATGIILLYIKNFVESYIKFFIIDFLTFYIFSVVCCSILFRIQKRFLKQ